MTKLLTRETSAEGAAPALVPEENTYGYLEFGELKPCSREELIALCERYRLPALRYCWTPESSGLVPPAAAPFLFQTLKKRAIEGYQLSALLGALNLALAAAMYYIKPVHGGSFGAMVWFSSFYVFLFFFGLLPLCLGLAGIFSLGSFTPEGLQRRKEITWYYTWFAPREILYTWLIASGTILIFIIERGAGVEGAKLAAGLVKRAVWEGEVWRLVTGALLHADLGHLLMNYTALFLLGRAVEVLAHRAYLPLVLLVSALAGNLLSLFLVPSSIPVGISGGLMGLIGFMGILGYRRPKIYPPLFHLAAMVSVLVVGYLGLKLPEAFDSAGHFGGLLAGVILALLMVDPNGRTLPLSPSPLVIKCGKAALVIMAFATALAIKVIS